MIVVKAKIKSLVPGFSVSGDFAEALDKKAEELVQKAKERAEANHRKTIMAKDL